MSAPLSNEKQLKQKYLREEIIEKNYDPDDFTDWMEKQKTNGKKKN